MDARWVVNKVHCGEDVQMSNQTVPGVTVFAVGVCVLVAVFGPSWWFITTEKHHTETKPQYKCIEGYKFTNDRNRKQIINEHGHGIPCSDDFVLPNTLGVR